jgi:LacI family transcriptional regulator
MSTRPSTVSIADVAAAAGVSPTTVSHVISGKRPVSAETAEAVHSAMGRLGYVPNHAAQSLRRGMSRTLGLLVPDIANPYFAELARGAEDAGEQRGFNLVLCNTDFDAERESRYLDMLRGGGVAGMIYAAGSPPDTARIEAVAGSFRLVAVDEELPGVIADTVVSDNEHGGRLAGEHLARLGHRRNLVVDGPAELRSAIDRGRGFRGALDPASVEIGAVTGDYRATSATEAVAAELAGRGPWFTAVFAANDLMALGALEALTAAGLRVPEDVSVVGFDDTVLASIVRPALTTIRQPVYRMGWVAADRLAGALDADNPPEPCKTVLDVELVARQTTAAPRAEEDGR